MKTYLWKNNPSSEYWYGSDKKGAYVIRLSGHWSNQNKKIECKKIASYKWSLIVP